MRYECEKCDAPLRTGWVACPQCGEKFDSPVPEYVDESIEFTDVARATPAVPLAETIDTIPRTPRYDLDGNELPHRTPQPPTRPQVKLISLSPVPSRAPSIAPSPSSTFALPPSPKLGQGPIASGSYSDKQTASQTTKNILNIVGVVVVLLLVFRGIVSHLNATQVSSQSSIVSATMPVSESDIAPASTANVSTAPAPPAPLVLMSPNLVPQHQPQQTAPSSYDSMSVQSADNQVVNTTEQADQRMEAIYEQANDAYNQALQGGVADPFSLVRASVAIGNARKQMQALAPQTSPSRQSEFLDDYFRLNIDFNELTYASTMGNFPHGDNPSRPDRYTWGSEV